MRCTACKNLKIRFRSAIILGIVFTLGLLNQNVVFADNAININLSQHEDGATTGNKYLYLIDKSHNLSLDDVQFSSQWKTPQAGVTNRGKTLDVSWMKFKLQNPEPINRKIILEYVDPQVASLDIYYREANTRSDFEHLNFTFNKPVSSRPVPFYRPAFPLNVGGDQEIEVLIRILPGDTFLMHNFTSFRVWNDHAFQARTHRELALLIILICSEILMAIATLTLFYLLKEKLFLYYSFFAFSAASLFAAFSGLWSYFIATESYELWMVVIQISICQIATFMFVREFLQTKKHLPLADKLLIAAILIEALGILLNFSGYPALSLAIIDYTAIGYFILIPVGLIAHRKGVPHALLFTSSWIVFICGMVMASLRNRGYIADSFISQWLIYFGGFIEITLLATIMVLSVRRLQLKKLEAENLYRETLQETAQVLTNKVEKQTLLLKIAKEKAEAEARFDMLTGLPNRRAFLEIAKHFIARAKRSESKSLYLGIIDLDHFKDVNDTFGHSAGDEILRCIGKCFTNTTREIDIVSRIGGEEFALLMECDNEQGALDQCERLRANVENLQTEFNGTTIQVTISLGIQKYETGNSIDELMHKADKNLYLAKLQGRNQVKISS